MKQSSMAIVCNLFMVCCSLSCSRLNHSINLTVSESERYYKIEAHYNIDNTGAVEKCMDDHLRKHGDPSFMNTSIDGNLTLNNGTTFYIKNYPGQLEIKFDKTENSTAALNDIKSLAKDLKPSI
ncbi:MAG TPA: hypothetical protein VGG71_09630 [Chitinophagaceae bacterium]